MDNPCVHWQPILRAMKELFYEPLGNELKSRC